MFVASYRNTERGIARKQVPALKLVPKPEPVVAQPEPKPSGDDFALGVIIGLLMAREEKKIFSPADRSRALIAQVAARRGVSLAEVLSASRHKPIVEARFDAIVAVYRARPELTLPRIGMIFNKDHTSIIHALRKRGVRYEPKKQAA